MLNYSASAPYLIPDFNETKAPMEPGRSPLALLMETCNSIGRDTPVSPKCENFSPTTSPRPRVPSTPPSLPVSPIPRRATPDAIIASNRKSPKSRLSPRATPPRASPPRPLATAPPAVSLASLPPLLPLGPHLDAALTAYHSALAAATAAAAKCPQPGSPSVCKDPMCVTCQIQALHAARASPCSGCTSCPMPSPRDHVAAPTCHWVVDGRPCGARFSTSDELLGHVKLHMGASAAVDNRISHEASLWALRRPYFGDVLSKEYLAMQSRRFQPYGRPAAVPGLQVPLLHPAATAYRLSAA